MKKSLIPILSIVAPLLLTGCFRTLFHEPTELDSNSANKNKEMTPELVETLNKAAIEKDLQSIYNSHWKDNLPQRTASLPKRKTNNIQQIGYNQSEHQSRKPSSQLSISELLNRGESAKQNGNHSDASSYYHAILKKDPSHAIAHHQLAVIADKLHDFRTAERHYLNALKQKPDNPDLYSDLGYSYLMQNNYQAAESYLQQALQLRPSHQLALNNLGILYGRTGDYNRALGMFRRTGSEQEAQQKMTSLIPPSTKQPNQQYDHSKRTQLAEYQQREQPAPRTQPKTNNRIQPESIQELRRKMDQVRRDAIAKRNGNKRNITTTKQPTQQNITPPDRFKNQPRTIPLITEQPANNNQQQSRQAYYQEVDQRLQHQMNTRQLPDSRLNDAFREIEHSNQRQQSINNNRNSYDNRTQSEGTQQAYRPAHRQTDQLLNVKERERRDVDPLNSMNTWEPPMNQKAETNQHNTMQHQQSPGNSTYRYPNQKNGSTYLPQQYQQSERVSFPTRDRRPMQTAPADNRNQNLRSQNNHQLDDSHTHRQAARMGMSGGLNDMLPEETSSALAKQQQRVIPATHRSFAGTNSRLGGHEFAPAQPYGHYSQRNGSRQNNVQHSDYQQTDAEKIEAEQLQSALYWKDPRQMNADYGKNAGTHRQQYNMRQAQHRTSQSRYDRTAINRDQNRAASHLTRETIPLGNGTYSPQAGQYYGPDQYKQVAPGNNTKGTNGDKVIRW